MEKIKKLKISRVLFITNYILGVFLLLYIFLSGATLRLPQIFTVFFIMLILIFFIQPEAIILYHGYFMDPDNITEVKGILAKTQVSIPYRSISGERLRKSFVGRIFNYGSIIITSPNNEINIKGIRNPEKIYRMIEEKLTKFRKE